MAGGLRAGKVQEWTERVQRFEASSLTVARFCAAEGVSEASFYYWKKKLQGRAAATSRFQPVRVAPAAAIPRRTTTIQLGRGVQIELGNDLLVADLVVNRILDAVIDADSVSPKAK